MIETDRDCARTTQEQGRETGSPASFVHPRSQRLTMCQKGSAVERRLAKRRHIEVDIEIAHPGTQRCYGVAGNISRSGVSVHLSKGELPQRQRSVILNFKIWTGKETLYRRIYARVVHANRQTVGLEFAEHDFVAEAVVQDLMFYQRRERQRLSRSAGSNHTDSEREVPAGARDTV